MAIVKPYREATMVKLFKWVWLRNLLILLINMGSVYLVQHTKQFIKVLHDVMYFRCHHTTNKRVWPYWSFTRFLCFFKIVGVSAVYSLYKYCISQAKLDTYVIDM